MASPRFSGADERPGSDDLAVVDEDRTSAGALDAREAAQQRRLTRTRRTEQDQEGARIDVERDVVQCRLVGERLGETAQGDADGAAARRRAHERTPLQPIRRQPGGVRMRNSPMATTMTASISTSVTTVIAVPVPSSLFARYAWIVTDAGS